MLDSAKRKSKGKNKNLVIVGIGLGALVIIGLIITVIILSTSKKSDSGAIVNKSNSTSTAKTITVVSNGITSVGAADCTIPNKVLMSDFLGYSLTALIAKYGGASQINPKYTGQLIICENDKYFIRITAMNADQIANYIEIQEKEFGSCDAGIDNVKPWVDKSMTAVGLDPTTKGASTYDTGDGRSQIEYSNYMVGDKKTYLTIECNVTGDYIGVLTVLATN